MNHHSRRRRPIQSKLGQINARTDRGTDGKGNSGAGQHQAKLQVEPWRGDFGADRAGGGMQEVENVAQFHGQCLVSGRIGVSIDSNIGRFPPRLGARGSKRRQISAGRHCRRRQNALGVLV